MDANVTTAARGAEMSARDKILRTASELFYRDGIRAVGVDTIVEKSGVAKTSLYRWFPSKDALIAAFLEDQDRRFWLWWDKVAARHPDAPREQLRALLAGMVKRLANPQYRGCPFMNTAAEFADADHPGRVVARANRDEMRRRLGVIASTLGAADPARLADQMLLLVNGAYAAAQVLGSAGPQHELIDAADTLIDARLASGAASS
ncbi:MAG: TetR/AcrR family transcriptional regulator [Xanthobacteraceae bacterium]|jgi:AcrR family transcriptional regulator